MKVKVGVSNRHVHLCQDDFKILFGDGELSIDKMLVQPNQYASTSRVTIMTPKSKIENVRVLGPFRSYTQVEISKTDSYTLGLNPPIRNSGDLDSAEIVTIVGPNGSVTKPCCIIATRHLHMSVEEKVRLGFSNKEYVSIKIDGEKPAIYDNVYIKDSEDGVLELHLDTDDANACLIQSGQEVEVID